MGVHKRYKSPKALKRACDRYFEKCEGEYLRDRDGEIVFNRKSGEPIIVGSEPPTITGLALHLGFKTRKSLIDYAKSGDDFADVVNEAKLKVEHYNEMRLYDRDGCNGAKFNLQNNFDGYAEKVENDTKLTVKMGEGLEQYGG